MKRHRVRVVGVCVVFFILFGIWYFKFASHTVRLDVSNVPKDFWGITFSKKYAEELGLDWREAYLAMLDELKIRSIRIPVYWDDIELTKDSFSFADYDWMLEEGSKRNVQFILAVGRRLPRWPECHQPDWTTSLSSDAFTDEQLAMVSATIQHFAPYSSIRYWQLENEFFFRWFGICPKPDPELLKKEIALLRSFDKRPLILTDSGELNSWQQAAKYSDILGITIYRVVWNNYFGYFRWPWPAALYRAKASWVGKSPENAIVAELQAEPWPADFKKNDQITRDEYLKSISVTQLKTNSEIARRTGFRQAYFWGAEWWYWLKLHGDATMWQAAKEIISTAHEE